MNRRAVGLLAVAAVCAAGAGVAGWRLGWIGNGTEQAVPAAPAGEEPESWSATVLRTFETGGETTTSATRFARNGDRVRLEWTEGGRVMALVIRPDLRVNWLIDAEANSYVETPLGADGAPLGPDGEVPITGPEVENAIAAGQPSDGFAVRREHIGVENVGVHRCDVFRSRLESIDGTTSESTVWEAQDLAGLAVRSEIRSPGGRVARTELRDFTLNPDPANFELPPGAVQSRRTP